LGPTPQDVVMQHTEVIGRAAFPQYWTLGLTISHFLYSILNLIVILTILNKQNQRFHLCRWHYDNSTNLRRVIERNRAAKIPYVLELKRIRDLRKENIMFF
jgi:alpha-glucosidase (family GH31 glycosyl hydrolase)